MANTTKEKLLFTESIEDLLMSGFLYDRRIWVDFNADIDVSYFNNPHNAIIFKLFKKFFDKFGSFPTPEIAVDLVQRKKYEHADEIITQIEKIYNRDVLKPEELDYIHAETGGFIKNNKIQDAVLKAVELLEENKFSEIEEEIKQAVNWNADVNFGIQIQDVETRFEKLQNLVTNVVPSPWMALNEMIGGGFFNKELTIFVGGSSVGKSIALDNVALHAWLQGYNVVMITLELSEVRKAQRIDAAATGIAAQQIIHNKDKVIRFYENQERANKLFIKEYPYGSINARDIRQYLYQLDLYGHLKKPDLLLVDYLEIMNPITASKSTYEDQGTTGGNLRALGQEGDYPVVTACLRKSTVVETKENGKIEIQNIKENMNVLSNTGYNKVLAVKENKNTKCFKIKTKSGKEIICSENHLFPTPEGEKSIKTGLIVKNNLYLN